jgi:hypothetical protein
MFSSYIRVKAQFAEFQLFLCVSMLYCLYCTHCFYTTAHYRNIYCNIFRGQILGHKTKVLRVFLLAIHSHLYKRILFPPPHPLRQKMFEIGL